LFRASDNPVQNLKAILIRKIGLNSLLRLGSLITGFAIDAAILAFYGIGLKTDAFLWAFTLPRMLSGLLESRAQQVLVPTFTSLINSSDKRLISRFIGFSMLPLLAVSLGGSIASGALIPVLAPGLSGNDLVLPVGLSQILFLMVFFRGSGAFFQAILFARLKYAVASSAGMITNIVVIMVILICNSRFGIYSVALGYVLGSALAWAMSVLAVGLFDLRIRPSIALADTRIYRHYRGLIYPALDHGIGQAKVLIENVLASYFPSGSLSALRYATRIIEAVSGLLGDGILTASLPLFSNCAAAKRIEDSKAVLTWSIKLLFIICVPVCLYILFCSQDLLNLLYRRGRFTSEDVHAVSILMTMLVPYIVLSRLASIIQVPFYADFQFRVPLTVTAMASVVYAASATILRGMGVYSFPIAGWISSTLNVFLLTYLFKRFFGNLEFFTLANFACRFAVVCCFTALGLWAGVSIPHPFDRNDFFTAGLTLFFAGSLGGVAFLVGTRLFGLFSARNVVAVLLKAA
jgi:putative peptidoglycan lipid II flippase